MRPGRGQCSRPPRAKARWAARGREAGGALRVGLYVGHTIEKEPIMGASVHYDRTKGGLEPKSL